MKHGGLIDETNHYHLIHYITCGYFFPSVFSLWQLMLILFLTSRPTLPKIFSKVPFPLI